MAKTGDTKMTLSLDSETKRLLRNLTRAVDRLARSKWEETEGSSGVRRLSEPAEDSPDTTHHWTGAPNDGSRVELDPETIQNLAQSILNQKSYLQ